MSFRPTRGDKVALGLVLALAALCFGLLLGLALTDGVRSGLNDLVAPLDRFPRAVDLGTGLFLTCAAASWLWVVARRLRRASLAKEASTGAARAGVLEA